MITCAEFVSDKSNRRNCDDVTLHVQDLLDFILSPDACREKTVFQSNEFFVGDGLETVNEIISECKGLLAEWQPPAWEKDDDELQNMAFRRKYRTRHADVGDDIDVERYIDGKRADFWTTVYKDRTEVQADAVTYLLDVNVSCGDSRGTRLQEQGKEMYMIGLKNERLGIPFRIIGVDCVGYPENKFAPRRTFYVIKDWGDPLSPNMFGWFATNRLANLFSCLYAARVMGTRHSCLGRCINCTVSASRDFPGEQIKTFDGNNRLTVVD